MLTSQDYSPSSEQFGSIPTIETFDSKDIADSNFPNIDFNFVFEKVDTLYCILQNPSPKTIALKMTLILVHILLQVFLEMFTRPWK